MARVGRTSWHAREYGDAMTGPTTRPASGRDRARTARPGGWLRRQRPRSALVLAAVLLLGSGGSLVLDGRPVAAVDANGYEATLLPLGSYTSGSVVDVRGSLAVGTVYGQDCQGGCAAWWDLSLAEPAGPTVLPLTHPCAAVVRRKGSDRRWGAR